MKKNREALTDSILGRCDFKIAPNKSMLTSQETNTRYNVWKESLGTKWGKPKTNG